MAEAKHIEVLARGNGPRKRLFFNAFSTSWSKLEGFFCMEFAFLEHGEAIDTFQVYTTKEVISENKVSFLKFAETLDDQSASQNFPEFSPYVRHEGCEFADLIGLARHGSFGEMVIHSFSWKSAIETPKNKVTGQMEAIADMVALLRCPNPLLKKLIFSMYAGENLRSGK